MGSAVIAENFISSKKGEYIHFIEHLGIGVSFTANKWVCDKLRRAPAEKSCAFTLYFNRIPEQHRDVVKYFSAISLIRGKSIATVKTYVGDLIRFFGFWIVNKKSAGFHSCDEFAAAEFYQHLEERGLAEATNIGVWSSVNTFFKTMNGWDDKILKNPFSISPYCHQRRFDDKYIPERVALQLDAVFQRDEIILHMRCAYWLLRLIDPLNCPAGGEPASDVGERAMTACIEISVLKR